jgi:hypothetical protein
MKMKLARLGLYAVFDLEGGLLLSKLLGPVNRGDNSVCQGAGGEVAIGEIAEPSCDALESFRKSPECKADLGRSISVPATMLSGFSCCTVFGDSLNSAEGSNVGDELCFGELFGEVLSGDIIETYDSVRVGFQVYRNASSKRKHIQDPASPAQTHKWAKIERYTILQYKTTDA